MSVKLYSWAWAQVARVSPKAHHVLLALTEFADKHGVCFPSQSTLASKTGWGNVQSVDAYRSWKRPA